ncbi:MAG TPA: uroporphyrinogen-III synthase [Sphingomicrobium sp.]|nr:uroporphyrinogen-III synthase [Sphingomicrobium sp.]
MRRILVLRPEPGASATATRARELGLDVIAVPLFEVEPIGWTAPDPSEFDGLLLTSANAVRHSGKQLGALGGLPVYAVGKATGEAAAEAGFSVAAIGDSGAEGLLRSIDGNLRLLHLCGEHHKDLGGARQEVMPVPVYSSKAIEDLDLGAAKGAVALIHSPRSGARFAGLVGERKSIVIAAISPAAANAVGSGWERVETSPKATDNALLALAARLCNIPAPE